MGTAQRLEPMLAPAQHALRFGLLRPAVEHFEMSGALIESREDGASALGDVADYIIFANEGPDRVEIVEPHQGLELDLVAEVAAHQVDVAKAADSPSLDPWNTSPRTIVS